MLAATATIILATSASYLAAWFRSTAGRERTAHCALLCRGDLRQTAQAQGNHQPHPSHAWRHLVILFLHIAVLQIQLRWAVHVHEASTTAIALYPGSASQTRPRRCIHEICMVLEPGNCTDDRDISSRVHLGECDGEIVAMNPDGLQGIFQQIAWPSLGTRTGIGESGGTSSRSTEYSRTLFRRCP
jgi:hypothetical protein